MTRREDSKVNGKISSINLRKEDKPQLISIRSIRTKMMMRKKSRSKRRETSSRKLIAKKLTKRTLRSNKSLVVEGIQLYLKDLEGAARRKLRTGRE